MTPGGDPLQTAEAAELRGELGLAVTAYERLLAAGSPSIAAEARFRIGRVAWRQGRFDDALAHYADAADAASTLALTNLRARIENGIGAVHYARGEYAQARASYGVALDLAGDDASLRAKVLLNLGVIANIQGELETARAAYIESDRAFAAIPDSAGRALALHNLGMVNADLELWEEAAESYAGCLTLSEQQGDRQMVANVLLNQCELHSVAGRNDLALANCDRAMIIYGELGDEPGRGDALRTKSRTLRLLGRLEEADANAAESLRIATKLQSRLLAAEATRELGLVRLAAGDAANARLLLGRAVAAFTELGAAREVADVSAELQRLT